jgi:hypothetical protein
MGMPDTGDRCAMPITGTDRHCKRSRAAGSEYCYQHQREPAPTEDDLLAVLRTLGAPGVTSLPMFDVRDRILTDPVGDARTREHREWTRRSLTLIGAHIELYNRGLIYESVPADGVHPGEMKLTDAGRETLALEGKIRS